jgi:hypothetical protein
VQWNYPKGFFENLIEGMKLYNERAEDEGHPKARLGPQSNSKQVSNHGVRQILIT